MKILCIAVSHRQDSLNKKLAQNFENQFLSLHCSVTNLDFDKLCIPLFHGEKALNKDDIPNNIHFLNAQLQSHDALILCSPEYNSSISCVLKNMIDWLSVLKPNPFLNKPVLLSCATPSETNGKMGLWQTRIPLEALFAQVHSEMFCLNKAHLYFDEKGKLNDEKIEQRLKNLAQSFMNYCQKLLN
ncbi:MAG: NAD(P)H-dependent oxidoreductase [Silvanigrellaceae bacterium]|nr:NAD(P)H-dependent oxidoreductase [Silvanigrellaceae bacterium]